MRTRKCAGIVWGIIFFLLLGFIKFEVLFFVIPLLVLLFIGVITIPEDRDIEVERELSKNKVFEDEEIEVKIRLKSKKNNLVEIYDTIPDEVILEKGSNYSLLSIKKEEEINYSIRCPIRGNYSIGPLNMRILHFLGLFYQERIYKSEEITVIPRIEEIRIERRIRSGIAYSHSCGIGTEFFGIREYNRDPFKRINWMASARWNSLLVNEYELERRGDFIIIIDSRDVQAVGSPIDNPLKYSIRAAASLASFLREDRVSLLIYGNQIKWLYPDRGEKQLSRILHELLNVRASGNISFATAIESIDSLPKTIILISSLEDDLTIPTTIEDLIAKGFEVLVVSPSPLIIEKGMHPNDKKWELAFHILNLERENLVRRLEQYGALVVNWDPRVSLSEIRKVIK